MKNQIKELEGMLGNLVSLISLHNLYSPTEDRDTEWELAVQNAQQYFEEKEKTR